VENSEHFLELLSGDFPLCVSDFQKLNWVLEMGAEVGLLAVSGSGCAPVFSEGGEVDARPLFLPFLLEVRKKTIRAAMAANAIIMPITR
jgi:hypothetical protein